MDKMPISNKKNMLLHLLYHKSLQGHILGYNPKYQG